jgi:broad specificity phosphatase PhoE
MTRLILIRHGQTAWNAEGRWQGQTDVPLNSYGLEQAQRIATELAGAGIQIIYTSDMQRALQTVEPLVRRSGLPMRIDPRLREIHQGDWQGLLVSDIVARYGELFYRRQADPAAVAPPGGETIEQVRQRAYKVFDEILDRHPDGTVAIVGHGFVIALLRLRLENRPLEDVWQLVPKSGQWLEYVLPHRR